MSPVVAGRRWGIRDRRPWRLSAAAVVALSCLALLASAAPASAGAPPLQLLRRYQPVTWFQTGEAFFPTAVSTFIADAQLEARNPDGSWRPAGGPPPTRRNLPVRDFGGCASTDVSPCWRLNESDCSPAVGLASLACYLALSPAGGARVVYGRFTRSPKRIVLQYWYFYAYNFWSLHFPPDDFVWQAHEGDWEVVTVVLSRRGRPLFAAYSQHCSGQRRSWSDVEKTRGHPLVYVAIGSHANYFEPGIHAIDVRCYPPQVVQFFQAAGLTPVDSTGRGVLLGPAHLEPFDGAAGTRLVRVTRRSPRWMRFPGTWGEVQFVHAPPPIGTVPLGTSPFGPREHGVWRRPVATTLAWPLA